MVYEWRVWGFRKVRWPLSTRWQRCGYLGFESLISWLYILIRSLRTVFCSKIGTGWEGSGGFDTEVLRSGSSYWGFFALLLFFIFWSRFLFSSFPSFKVTGLAVLMPFVFYSFLKCLMNFPQVIFEKRVCQYGQGRDLVDTVMRFCWKRSLLAIMLYLYFTLAHPVLVKSTVIESHLSQS